MALEGITWMIKFFSIIFMYHYFSDLFKNNLENNFFLFVKVSLIILSLNLIAGLFGFGYAQYAASSDNPIGTRGFIFAGNEMGGAIIASGSILLMLLIEKRKYFIFLILSIFLIFMGALLTSKVSIFSALLILLFFPLIKASKKLKKLKIIKKDFYFSNLILIIFPMISFGGIYYALYESNLITRLEYFYERVDLITLIMSHRNVWMMQALDAYLNKYTIFELFFGTGKDWFQYISEYKMVEIDLIDFLMTYGLIGVLISYGFWIYIIYKMIKYNKSNPYYGYLIFMLFLFLILSLTSGHILNSGIAGPLIAGLLAMTNIRKN